MAGDFFLGFAGHAHTKNEIGTDPNSEMELRNRNNTKEAQELTESIFDKIEGNCLSLKEGFEKIKKWVSDYYVK